MSDKAIEFKSISKVYPGTVALDDISFSISTGSIHGLLGPNGAGKSTSMKIMSGLITKTSGELLIRGEAITENNNPKIGFLPEIPPLYETMTVSSFLDFVAKINKSTHSESVSETMKTCQLADVKNKLIGNLSKGYKQRVGIAQALIPGHDIIILDEPTIGLDPVAISEVRNLIKDLSKTKTIILSSHLLNEIEQLCSEITIIQKGKTISSGKIEDVQKEFGQKQTYCAELKSWNNELERKLKENFNSLKNISSKSKNEAYFIQMEFNEANDPRSLLYSFFVETNSELISLEKTSNQNLENIFLQLSEREE